MPIDPDVAIGAQLPDRTFSWESSDVLLYHLGIGAGSQPGRQRGPCSAALHARQRRPAGAAQLRGRGADLPRDRPAAARPARLRHQPRPGRARQPGDRGARPDARSSGRRSCTRGSPTSGTRARPRSSGRRGSALAAEGEPLWTVRSSIFVRGEGGWGGDRGTSDEGRAPRPRARLRRDVRRDAAAGAALPPLRRPQPAARRPGVRRGRRLPGADPARAVHLRHRAAHGDRRAARRGRRQGPRRSPRASPAWCSPARRSGCAPGTATRASSSRRPSSARATGRRARALRLRPDAGLSR